MPYQETLSEKRTQAAQATKQQQEFMTMIRSLQQVAAAALAGSSKPSVVLTDQTDLGDKMKDMVEKFTEAVKATDQSKLSSEQLASLKELKSGIDSLKATIANKKTDNNDVVAAIKALKLNVAAPIVNVPAQAPTDFTPLQDTIREYFRAPEVEEEKIDLECYRAQDIKESGDVQYVGFVNPEGHWYIIENKMSENQMRYVFGNAGYATAFTKAAQYEYMLLNEAINAARP